MPDTYTSQFSGEEIDAALRAAQIISGASTPAELRDKLEIRGDTIPVSATDPTPISEALTASGGGINPNLLDNWFFARPVNQRGQTEYTGNNYYIDRWRSWDGDSASLSVVSGGIKIAGTLYQYFESTVHEELWGKTITISLLLADGTLYTNSFALKRADWYTVHINAHGLNAIQFGINNNDFGNANNNFLRITPTTIGTLSDTLLAAKLELGDTQTLAHKENGVWVLNEVPDYGEQLARCQRHAFSPLYEAYATAVICNLFVSSVANGVAFGEVTLPVTMRNKPVFSGNASKFWIVAENGGGASHPTAISVMGLSADKVMIQVNGSYTANTQYILYVEDQLTSADFLLSADL